MVDAEVVTLYGQRIVVLPTAFDVTYTGYAPYYGVLEIVGLLLLL